MENKIKVVAKGLVLVVESSEELKEKIKEECEERGFRVLTTRKLTEALLILQKQKFDCIITNIHVNEEASHQFIVKLKKGSSTQNSTTPLILIGEKFAKEDFEKIGKNINFAMLAPFKAGAISEAVDKFIA